MGEVAEMMLDGTLCNQCGVFLDSEPTGLPTTCPGCTLGAVGAGLNLTNREHKLRKMQEAEKAARKGKLKIIHRHTPYHWLVSGKSQDYNFYPSTSLFIGVNNGVRGKGLEKFLREVKQNG